MSDLTVIALCAIALFGLVGGIGITAVGPGGVLPTIGLFALTTLPPATIAGTAIVTHIATGILGTLAYLRSGQLRDPATQRTAIVLAFAAVVGTPVGVWINTAVSKRAFGIILAVFAISVAGLLWRRGRSPVTTAATSTHPPTLALAIIGLLVAIAAGIAGLGGPMLCVPILVVLHVPMLEALAAAQVQSIVVASVGTIGYAANGSIDWPLAVLIGGPELVGVLLGWQVARSLSNRILTNALITALVAVTPILLLKS